MGISLLACMVQMALPRVTVRHLSRCISFSLYLFLSVSLSLSLSLYISLYLSVSLCLSLSLYISLYLSVSLSLSLSLYLCISLFLYISLCTPLCTPLCGSLSVPLSVDLALSLSLSLPPHLFPSTDLERDTIISFATSASCRDSKGGVDGSPVYLGLVGVMHTLHQTIDNQFALSSDGVSWWRPARRPNVPLLPLGEYGGGLIWSV